jgi:uncharacterized protein (TIGR03435 family)
MLRALLVFTVLAGSICRAQSVTPPTFEVAAIKPSTVSDGGSSSHSRNGRITIENFSVKQIIMYAYGIQNYQFSGPRWLDDERYNIDAKADIKVEHLEVLGMLRTLLADRFKLQVHHESKAMQGYAMVVGKAGLKVKPVDGEGSGMNTNNNKLTATHVSMERLANRIAQALGQPVVDETGVKDSFSFVLEYADPRPSREDRKENAASLPSIFTALAETLGVKLESRNVPIDVVVVDRIERPTEN